MLSLLGGDASGDEVINAADFSTIANDFNTRDTASDINQDGIVDIYDLVRVGRNFGKTGGSPEE